MIINDINFIRRRLVGLLLACSAALPALAEGGMYPSASFMLGLLVVYTLGVPIAVAAVAYAVLRLFFRLKQPKTVAILFVALLTWNAGLLLNENENLKLPFGEDLATLLRAALSLGVTVAFGFWMGRTKSVGPR